MACAVVLWRLIYMFHAHSLTVIPVVLPPSTCTAANIAVPHSASQESGNQCLGCDTAFLIQHLVRALQWSSVRLPVDGLKSAIFLNPSPTLCLASGNRRLLPDHGIITVF